MRAVHGARRVSTGIRTSCSPYSQWRDGPQDLNACAAFRVGDVAIPSLSTDRRLVLATQPADSRASHGGSGTVLIVSNVDLRMFSVVAGRDRHGRFVADTIHLDAEFHMPVRLADVVKVNALSVPLSKDASYRVLQHELRLLLSYLPGRIGSPLRLCKAEFQASASHIRRFVTESLGLGMLTAAVESQFKWQRDARALAHFDVLPARLVGRYQTAGARPDLLFGFGTDSGPRRLAGEARGRSGKRHKAPTPSTAQRRRLDEILDWSDRHRHHPVTMTWAYTGADTVEVDMFVLNELNTNFDQPQSIDDDPSGPRRGEDELTPDQVAARAEKRVRRATDDLYRTAPDSSDDRFAFDRQVRGEWAPANLLGPSNLHLFLGVMHNELAAAELAAIRRARETDVRSREDDPIQVEVLGRIVIAVSLDRATAPPWAEVRARLNT